MNKNLLKQALDALESMKQEFRGYDLPYGSKAYAEANEVTHALSKELAEPVRILRAEMNVGMGLTAYLLTDFTVKTLSPAQADKMGWWKHGEHAAPGAAPPAAPADEDAFVADVVESIGQMRRGEGVQVYPPAIVPDDMVMVPRDILARLVEEARVFEPSVLDPDALAHARRILAAAPAPVVPLTAQPVAWAKQEKKRLRITHIDMQGEHGWQPLVFGAAVLSAAPVVREPLTDEQIRAIGQSLPVGHRFHSRMFARAIELAHGIGVGK